jgi:hypothetical protein
MRSQDNQPRFHLRGNRENTVDDGAFFYAVFDRQGLTGWHHHLNFVLEFFLNVRGRFLGPHWWNRHHDATHDGKGGRDHVKYD